MAPYAFANVAASTTDKVLVPAVAGKSIRVLGLLVLAGGTATSVTFNSLGSSSTPVSIALACAANGGLVLPENSNGWMQSNAGESLSVTTGSGSTVGVQLVYELI